MPTTSSWWSTTGIPLMRSIIAMSQGRHDEAVDGLMSVRDTTFRFGGSHAQRDLLDLTLIAAAERAGNPTLADALKRERAFLTPLAMALRRPRDGVYRCRIRSASP